MVTLINGRGKEERGLREVPGNSLQVIDPEERLVAGWASVEIVDRHGELIPIEVIEKKMYEYVDRGGVINLAHSNKPVGKILRWEVREHPEVNAKGIWIVAKIFKDYDIDDQAWEMIKRGEIRGFSIGGTKNPKMVEVRVLKDGKGAEGLPPYVKVLKDIDLFEISLAPEPANQLALIEEVNYLAKTNDGKKFLTFEDLKRIYGLKDEDYARACGLCKYIKEMFEKTGDLDLAIRAGYALYHRDMRKKAKMEKIRGGIDGFIHKIKAVSSMLDIDKAISGLEELMKPFGKWENFQDCVDDMKSKGYDEESAKRICGSLQAKLEKQGEALYSIAERMADFLETIYDELIEVDDERAGEILDSIEDLLDEIYDVMMDEVGEDGIDDEEETVSEEDVKAEKTSFLKDMRPPKKWWERCVERTGRPALCGWIYYHHLRQRKPESVRGKDKPHTAEARARKRRYGIPPP